MTQNGTEMHHLGLQSPKKNSGGGPPDPLETGCFIWGSFKKHVHTLPSAALHAFDFLVETHFDPCSHYTPKRIWSVNVQFCIRHVELQLQHQVALFEFCFCHDI